MRTAAMCILAAMVCTVLLWLMGFYDIEEARAKERARIEAIINTPEFQAELAKRRS